MRLPIAILTVLLLAQPAVAADPPPPKATTTPSTKAKAPASDPVKERIRAAMTAKAGFMAAVGSCTRPELCDPKSTSASPDLVFMLENAEKKFMDACRLCAKEDLCEAERTRILAGKGRFGYNACIPEAKPPKK